MRYLLFWGIIQRALVFSYRRCGTRCRPHL